MLACFDKSGQLSDLYSPYVGQENHVGSGRVHKIGIFVDGVMSWVSDADWHADINYQKDTFASSIRLVNEALGVTLVFEDAVYNERNILMRRVQVTNTRALREIKLFFNQQYSISENPRGDTGYYAPSDHAMVHYKGRRVFVASVSTGSEFFDDYAVGLLGIEGREGTWRDAEDGVLSKSPVEHGAVDSVMGLTFSLRENETKEVWHWIAAADSYRDAISMHRDIIARSPKHLLTTTIDYWRAWIGKRPFSFYGLDTEVVDLFKKSLLIIRAHFDHHGGIIASSDSDIIQYGRDTYAYVWPRDAAYAALSLDKAGYDDISERFFSFCADALTDDGYLLHKYRPDGSLGSSWHPWIRNGTPQLPIQEDETAIVLFCLWEHYEISKNLEFIESMYNPLVKASADFLVRHRDTKTGLPLPSYDLWEERWGISCYTTAATIGGLEAAARFATLLGKNDAAKEYAKVAASMRSALETHFYDPTEGYFIKLLEVVDGALVPDRTVDAASAYGVLRFNVLPAADERLKHAFLVAEQHLSPEGVIGGIARYEGDRYYQTGASAPANPWFIPTFWSIEYQIAQAKSEDDLLPVKEKLKWAAGFAVGAGMLAEQINPQTGAPLSVCPLTWSHAAYVLAVIAYLEKLEALGICATCYPVGN
mgnify:CR=1 FL=1